MVTFQLHRNGVILIVILCLVVAALLVATGYLWHRASVEPAALGRPPAPAAAVTSNPPAPTAEGGRRYTLRVGIERTEEDAKTAVKSLGAKKVAATITPVETSTGDVIYEIHTGSYADRSAAAKAAAELQDELHLTAAVVPAP
jgi:hypothetical protein